MMLPNKHEFMDMNPIKSYKSVIWQIDLDIFWPEVNIKKCQSVS